MLAQKTKILVIQTAFIGDIALSIFFANDIKQIFPNSEITFISTKIGCQILQCFKIIDNTISYDKRNSQKGLTSIIYLAKSINQTSKGFDIIFALHRSFRTAILTKLINAKTKIGFNTNSLSFLLDCKVIYSKELHEIVRNRKCLEVVKDLEIVKNLEVVKNIADIENFTCSDFDYLSAVEKIKKSFFITDDDRAVVARIMNARAISNRKNIIVVAAGSVWETKRWKVEYFAELCKSLTSKDCNSAVILIGSENEIELSERIMATSESGVISIAGKTTLPQTLEIIRNSQLVISNDSAPTHFATLMNISTITIFGPTSSSFGFAPLAEKSISIEDNLFCRPCSIHGTRKCPRNDFKCMENIKPAYVLAHIQNILQ